MSKLTANELRFRHDIILSKNYSNYVYTTIVWR